METIIYLVVFLIFDIVILIYLSNKYNARPWQIKKLFKAWYREYGGY